MLAARRGTALTGEEALAGYTLAPARAVGEAGGRIRVGLRADLTGLVEDPVHAPDAPVWLTVVAGRVVHRHGDVVGGASGRRRKRFRQTPVDLVQPHTHAADQLRHPAGLGLAQRLAQQLARARSASPRAISISAYSRRISATTGRSPQAALRSSAASKCSSARVEVALRGAEQGEEAVRGAEVGGLGDLHELLAVRLEQPVEHRRLLACRRSARTSRRAARSP